ncbi:MAG: sigma-54-dependent Fis family transcriptional regulator, partial [Deltaproteobacteria bacterium]
AGGATGGCTGSVSEGTTMRKKILLVDAHQQRGDVTEALLRKDGFEVCRIEDRDEIPERMAAEKPDALILAAKEGEEASLCSVIEETDRPVFVVSSDDAPKLVVQVIKAGAKDFLKFPFDRSLKEVLFAHFDDTCDLDLDLSENPTHYDLLFASRSEKLRSIRMIVDQVAGTDITVLIRGESGTGKGVAARAIANRSRRAKKPFITVNCAALPEVLLESELFGYEKGAFTGAQQRKPGKFEFANGGTIFLDEISEMSPSLQAKLLQVLQDGEFSRLGSNTEVKVDTRVIAATNRDLEKAVADGSFREDLFYRLNVVSIFLPPLRERKEDIKPLMRYFVQKYNRQYNRNFPGFSKEAEELFLDYDWPGNVRELENMTKRAVVLQDERVLQNEILTRKLNSPSATSTAATQSPPPTAPEREGVLGLPKPTIRLNFDEPISLKEIAKEAARNAEREVIGQVLQKTRWNRKEAARILQISYKALLYKIRECGLE